MAEISDDERMILGWMLAAFERSFVGRKVTDKAEVDKIKRELRAANRLVARLSLPRPVEAGVPDGLVAELRQAAINAGVTYPENHVANRAANAMESIERRSQGLREALKTARTLVISYRAHEKGKRGNRSAYCQSVLETIDAALARPTSPATGDEGC